MAMHNKGEITNLSMSIQGSEILSTEKLSLLGVTIDNSLILTIITTCVKKQVKGLESL